MISMPPSKRRRAHERGNVFLFILLGVVLFAGLAMVITRSMRTETVTTISSRDATLAATEILDYAQRLGRAVDRLRRRNISENDISFDNDFVAGYDHGVPDANSVFSAAGGLVTWQDPIPGANDGSDWIFTGSTCVFGVGTGPANCDSNGVSTDEELIAVLPNLQKLVCEEIDSRLGIAPVPDGVGTYSTTKFTGTFADGTAISTAVPYNAACISDGGVYFFYVVLMER
jgi:hypothetical protein